MRGVAIVGSAQSKHEQRKADKNVEQIIYETVRSLLDNTGVDIKDIVSVIGAGDDVLDGRSISNVFTAEYAGAFLKEESKVEDDGAFAALYGAMRIAAGSCETALVYAYSKGSDSSPRYYSGMIADPFYLRPLGIEATTAAALQAACYYQRYGVTEEQVAGVVVKNRKHGACNSSAALRREVTLEEVLNSPPLASPIKKMEAAPVTDGCCAILLASEHAAKGLGRKVAWIRGVGFCTDAFYLGHRDLTEVRAAHLAAERAYKMAGVTDPAAQIACAEVHEQFAFHELMLYEALGLCEKGKGGQLLACGVTDALAGGALPVNASGGALCADPIFATGLIRLAEAAARVTGERPQGANVAVAHAASGFCLQSNIVYVLGARQ